MDKKRTGQSLKDLLKQDTETSSKALKSQSVKTLKRQRAKPLKQPNAKTTKGKRKHTVYLSPEQSKKLRVYAAQNDMQLSEVIEKLIDKKL
ncbi:hypothetical protein ES702_05275 [subsurface metagenome]